MVRLHKMEVEGCKTQYGRQTLGEKNWIALQITGFMSTSAEERYVPVEPELELFHNFPVQMHERLSLERRTNES